MVYTVWHKVYKLYMHLAIDTTYDCELQVIKQLLYFEYQLYYD